jgi:hypothetical protein
LQAEDEDEESTSYGTGEEEEEAGGREMNPSVGVTVKVVERLDATLQVLEAMAATQNAVVSKLELLEKVVLNCVS